jgi:DnaK suppressor protein
MQQRAMLLKRMTGSLILCDEPVETCADPADQASADFEQDLAIQAKVRTLKKLREIERAIRLLQTPGYGRCRRCQAAIPFERLKVKPDALFCVPCLALIERDASGR